MWEGQRAGPAARRVCHGLGAGGGLDWRRGLEGRSRGTCSRGQLKFLKDDLVLENSARSCRRVADPGALAVWGGEWVPPNRVVATAAQTQDSRLPLPASGCESHFPLGNLELSFLFECGIVFVEFPSRKHGIKGALQRICSR